MNSTSIDFEALAAYARHFSNLSEQRIVTLHTMSDDIIPHLQPVTDTFYQHLSGIERAQPFLDGKIDTLKNTHIAWLTQLFTGSFDADYAEYMYKVGDVHVRVNLPVEFMAGGITLINEGLTKVIIEIYKGDEHKMMDSLAAMNAALGYSLLIMQESYQSSSLAGELEKFLKITGMSRKLFENLAHAYQ